MKEWIIPVKWEVCGTVMAKADTLEEAIIEVENNGNFYNKVEDGGYVDDSFEVVGSDDPDYIRDFYNSGQKDDAGRLNKYEVTVEVTGRVTKWVSAENEEKAKDIAYGLADEDDFGVLDTIDYPDAKILCHGPVSGTED